VPERIALVRLKEKKFIFDENKAGFQKGELVKQV